MVFQGVTGNEFLEKKTLKLLLFQIIYDIFKKLFLLVMQKIFSQTFKQGLEPM